MIVVDTNIIAYLFLDGQYTMAAESLFQIDSQWIAPALWRSEFRNILALYLRQKILTYEKVVKIIEQAENLMEGNEYTSTSFEILKIARDSNCSSYDCELICLAKEFSIPLVTQDKKILREFPNVAVSIKKIISTTNREILVM